MDWFEYSCCGYTFARLVRKPDVEATCPRCRQQVKPLVSLHIKGGQSGQLGLAHDPH